MSENQNKFLLRKEAAAYLRLSVSALAHMACRGEGPRFYKAGKLTRYRVSDLEEWALQERREPLPLLLQQYQRRRSRA